VNTLSLIVKMADACL